MFNTFVSEHHHFLQSEPNASGHHDFLQAEPWYLPKKASLTRFEAAEPKRSRQAEKPSGTAKRRRNHGNINSVVDLVEALHSRRKEWSSEGHSAESYVVSNQDSIKMHINMYLGHMARFFFKGKLDEINALVLDASDMGTSLIFDIFGIHNIVVPNYYKGSTDFEIMRMRMPLCMSLPVSVEDYIKIWAESNRLNYAENIFHQANEYRYQGNTKQKHLKNLASIGAGERPLQFDIVYLDWCGAFGKKSRKTIKTLLSTTDPTVRPKIVAVTGSIMGTGKQGNNANKQVDSIIAFMKKRMFIMDQVFIYHRHVSHSRVAPGVEIQRTILNIGDRVKASPDGYVSKHEGTVISLYKDPLYYRINFDDTDFGKQKVHRSKITNKGGMVMFFISFVRAPATQIEKWNNKFKQCNGKACKLSKKNRYCLYHETDGMTQRFCNRLLGNFYVYTTQTMETGENFKAMLGDDVPLGNFNAALSNNKRQKTIPSIFSLQLYEEKAKVWQMYDAGQIQDYISQTRNITYRGKREFKIRNIIVRVEAVFEKSLAFSISSMGNQSLLSLKKKKVADIFKKVDCLFPKTETEVENALIFITKMAFDNITDSSSDSDSSDSDSSDSDSSDSEEEEEEEMQPFHELEVGDRVTYLWNPPDETYEATVIKITASARVATLKFDDGEQITFTGGWFNEENYGKQWWYMLMKPQRSTSDSDSKKSNKSNPKIATPEQIDIIQAWYDEHCEYDDTELTNVGRQAHKFHCTLNSDAKKSFEKYRAERFDDKKSDFPKLHSKTKLYAFLDGIYGEAYERSGHQMWYEFLVLKKDKKKGTTRFSSPSDDSANSDSSSSDSFYSSDDEL